MAMVPAVSPYLLSTGTSLARAAFNRTLRNVAFRASGSVARRALNFGFRQASNRIRNMSTLRRRRQVGDNPNSTSAKRDQILTSDVEIHSIRELHFFELTNISQQLTGERLNARQRALAVISGFKIRMLFMGQWPRPLVVNCAIVKPRQGAGSTVSVDGFFREYGGASRDVNFSTALSQIELANNPINTDKYIVLWRRRFMLGALSDTTDGTGVNLVENINQRNENAKNYKYINKYFRLKRGIRYNDDSNTDAEQKVFFVHWADRLGVPAGSGSAQDGYTTQSSNITFFREPRVSF